MSLIVAGLLGAVAVWAFAPLHKKPESEYIQPRRNFGPSEDEIRLQQACDDIAKTIADTQRLAAGLGTNMPFERRNPFGKRIPSNRSISAR